MRHYSLMILFVLSAFHKVQPQNIDQTKIISQNAYAEKIYLQLNSTVFTTENTIWFKAIVTDLAHFSSKLSGVLHVELIDFDERIIDKKQFKLKNGITNGFFDLEENLPSGRYLLRAYTQWNKNFGNDFISQVYIDIHPVKKISEKDRPIRNITLTESSSGSFQLSATAYPELLNPEFRGKLKMYIHTDSNTDSLSIQKDENSSYSFRYTLPEQTVKARMELKLDSVKLRNYNMGHVSTYSKTVAVNKHYLDLQFFPEGGRLINGLTSAVGFKALDYNNRGKQVKGFIVDENDAIVTPFQSNELGMGITYLKPNADKTYFAQTEDANGVQYKYPLPKTDALGVVLNVKERQGYVLLTLKTNDTRLEELRVKVQSRGVQYDYFQVALKEGKAKAGIEKSTLPEGIVTITVTNQAQKVVAERLFFNYKETERIHIKATPHLSHYSQRDKTVIELNTKNIDSSSVKANLSVLVLNKEQLGNIQNTRQNILSYFLLNSELRGNIEQSSFYFNPDNPRRTHDMDALMLTQGWRNYKYKPTKVHTKYEFFPEQALQVSGRVRDLLSPNKLLRKPLELTMIYGPLNVVTQKVDSTGQFLFQIEDYFKEDFQAVVQIKNEKGKKKSFDIDIHEQNSPAIDYEKDNTVYLADSTNVFLEEQINYKNTREALKVEAGTLALDAVHLEGYNLTPEREKIMDLHGPPDVVIENEELKRSEKRWHWGLFSLLQSSFPDDIEIIDTGGFLQAKEYGHNFTFIVIDGIPVTLLDYTGIEGLPVEEIKSFELIRTPKNASYYISEVFQEPIDEEETRLLGGLANPADRMDAGLHGVGVYEGMVILAPKISIISIYTYSGKGFYGARTTKGISKITIPGLTPQREFYAPKYSHDDINDWNTPDMRSVVHWAPNITTNRKGKAQVEFYNGDNVGDMLVVVEGITENGKLGYTETIYTVDRKIER